MKRVDIVPGTPYKIIQDDSQFCYGIDAILLADFVKPKGIVVDIGTGTGIIPLRIVDKPYVNFIYGIEVQKAVADIAKENVVLNGLQEKIEILNTDAGSLDKVIKPSSIDTVISNPPYMKKGSALINENESFAIARHELLLSLEKLVSVAYKALKPRGSLFMIHRPNRLVDVISCFRASGIEPKRIRFVHSKQGGDIKLFLIQGVKGGLRDLVIDKPLVVYKEDGGYCDEIYDIYGRERV